MNKYDSDNIDGANELLYICFGAIKFWINTRIVDPHSNETILDWHYRNV